MSVSRRKLFGAVALVAPVQAAEPGAIAAVAEAHGVSLSPERLRVIERVLASRKAQRETLRLFEIGESVEPTQGIRRK